jgi:hypothetical protein
MTEIDGGGASVSTEDQDRAEILRLHIEWLEANCGLDIPRMSKVFPVGSAYLMFNLNGHPYYGLEEKIRLWEHYGREIEIPMPPRDEYLRLDIRGDMAWLACEGVTPFRNVGPEGTGSTILVGGDEEPATVYWRATEVYVRDDGAGNPTWKMWHYHCSPHAPQDEPRPGFNDTYRDRPKADR